MRGGKNSGRNLKPFHKSWVSEFMPWSCRFEDLARLSGCYDYEITVMMILGKFEMWFIGTVLQEQLHCFEKVIKEFVLDVDVVHFCTFATDQAPFEWERWFSR